MEILSWVENQSTFIQGLIASAVFATTIWFIRIILKLAAKTGASAVKDYETIVLRRHWLYRYYVNSDNIHLRTVGFNTVILISFSWLLRGILVFVFFFCIDAILNQKWLWVSCSWFVFNLTYEAYQWLKDTSDPKHVEKIDRKTLEEFVSTLPEHQAKLLNISKEDG